MSSANKKQRGKLEEEFRQRMHDAEAPPSPDLWARIDHELTMGENEQNKKRVVFYRQLAAACFVLFVLAGALLGYQYRDEAATGQQPTLASNTSPANKATTAGAAEQQTLNPEAAPAAAGIADAGTQQLTAAESRAAGAVSGAADNRGTIAAASAQATQSRSASRGRSYPEATGAAENSTSAGAETIAAVAAPETAPAVLSPSSRHALSVVPDASTDKAADIDKAKQQMLRTIAFQEDLPKSILELNKQLKAGADTEPGTKTKTDLALNNPEKSEKGSGDSRWSLGMAYMPTYFNQNIGVANVASGSSRSSFDFAGPTLSATPGSYSNISAASIEFEDNTDPAYSFTFDMKTGFRLYKRLKLLTGIGYSQNAARTKSSYIVEQYNGRYKLESSTIFLPSLSNSFSTDSINVAKTDGFEVNYRYRQLSVPLGLQYEGKISKDWFWYGAAGVAANFLIESTIMSSNSDVADVSYGYGDDSPFRRVQFSTNVGAGVGKNISDKVSVVVGPEFRTFLNTMLADPENARAPQGRPYTIGFNMGVNYMLGTGNK